MIWIEWENDSQTKVGTRKWNANKRQYKLVVKLLDLLLGKGEDW